jgi:hypothetical protein
MNENDALSHLIDCIKSPNIKGFSAYGCDIYLTHIVVDYVRKKENNPNCSETDQNVQEKAQPFLDAAWHLCQRGILRSGVNSLKHTPTPSGLVYSITSQGRKWLQEQGEFIYKTPIHFSEILATYDSLFGSGFKQRAQEACSTYLFGCYLSTCVMCGAAAESIILKIAIANEPDKEEILKEYESRGGTKKIIDRVFGHLEGKHKNAHSTFNDLLKYRRDDSGHGQHIDISEFDAYDSLSRLIWLSKFIDKNFSDILRES